MGECQRLDVKSFPNPLLKGRPAVFFDRDGTLNEAVIRESRAYPPAVLDDFRLFPDAYEACTSLAAAGFALVVVTNQPDVGRGTQALETVEAMHTRLRELIPAIEHIEVCYNPGSASSNRAAPDRRRKPEPGMVIDAAALLHLDLERSWMVGDRWRDVDCGKRAGVRTIFLDYGYAEPLSMPPDFAAKSLKEATRIILANR